jgi:oligoribonuclease NrnB/cAMP/cGMP phosphodiesterase (DHH superfamily)
MNHIIYHNKDIDGWASGALLAYMLDGYGKDCKLHGRDYGDKLNINFNEHDTIYMTDISFDYETMDYLNRNSNFYWFDHHVSAIKNLDSLKLNGEQRLGDSATKIVYDWIRQNKETWFSQEIESLIYYIDRYDLFKDSDTHSFKNICLPVQYMLRIITDDPSTKTQRWFGLFREYDKETEKFYISRGQYIVDHIKSQLKVDAERVYYEEFDIGEGKSVTIPVINRTNPDIDILEYVDNEGAVCFTYRDKNHTVYSFRKTKESKVPILDICISNGGGGHPCACGFKQTITT